MKMKAAVLREQSARREPIYHDSGLILRPNG